MRIFIRPTVAATFQFCGDVRHARSALERQHKGHVFEQEPGRLPLAHIDKAEHFANETRLCPVNACAVASRAEVLTGESAGDEVAGRQVGHRSNVAKVRHIIEPGSQHCACERIVLGQCIDLVAGRF